MMIMVLRGAEVGDFREDRDWSTYHEVSISFPANRLEY